ncbi:MAG: ABC transporter substrate-binding protein [Nitrososphaerales archaeon]|nr:ABC transporter substrate-binding protein [Nitrososphaerales archaeon]
MNENKNAILAGAILSIFILSAIPLPTHAATSNLFSVTIIAPGNANPARREWGAVIANSLQNVGINAKEVFLPWSTVYGRVLLPDLSVRGKTFDQGGFDLQLVGYTPALFPISAEFLQFDSSQFAPSSGNYYLWTNSTADAKIRAAVAEGYTSQGVADLKAWENIQYQDRPEIPIEYDTAQYATNPGINYHGWDAYYANIGPVPQFVSYGSKTSMVVGTTGDFEQMLPLLTSSYYDFESFVPVYDSLFLLGYPSGFPTCGSSCGAPQIIPDLATGFSQAGNKLTYTLRSGVTFQDGVPFTANDVLYSFLAYSDFNSGSASAAALTSALGNDIRFTWTNGTTTELVNDNVAGTTVYYGPAAGKPASALPDSPARPASMVASSDGLTVTVTLGNFQGLTSPAAIFHPEFDSIAILPMHYLNGQRVDAGCLNGKTTCNWASSAFNTAQAGSYKSNGHTFTGPFGTGPYNFTGYDPVNAVTHLKKFSNYWNATALQKSGEYTLTNYYVQYISETDPAIAALKSGTVDALDPQYHYAVQAKAGLLSFAKVYAEPNAGQQEIGINMEHPILGTGKGTPAGTAAAARDIRLAIDYLIPRDLIISQLLVGSASPGDVPFAVGGYKDSSLTPRPYDPTTAAALLKLAGYNPTVGGGTFTSSPIPAFYVGMSQPIAGTFTNPVTGQPYASGGGTNYEVVLQSSSDNKTWSGVQGSTTDANGAFYFLYTPTSPGSVSLRVYFTGYTTPTSGIYSQRVRGGGNITVLPGSVPVAAPQYTSPVEVTAGSLSSVLGGLASQSNLNSLQTALNSASSQITTLQNSINSLQGQVSTLTTVAYGAIAIAIIVGIAGFVFARRKPS